MRETLPRRAALATIGCALLLLLAVLVEVGPRLTRENRVIASAPVPSRGRAPATLALRPGQTACQTDIVLVPDGDVLELELDPAEPLPAPPLRVTLRAPGYDASLSVMPDGHQLRVPFEPPARAVPGSLCVRNDGRRAATLAASADPRVLQRTRASVDGGAPLPLAFLTTFTQADRASLLGSLGTTADRASALNALGPWALWLLLPLLALAAPGCLLGAYYLALRGGADDCGADDGDGSGS